MRPSFIILPALTCALVALGCACRADVEREKQAEPREALFPVAIHQSPKLSSLEADTVAINGKPTRVRCDTCHQAIDAGTVATRPEELQQFHRGLEFNHGDLECRACHEPGEPLRLRLATGQNIPVEEAMTLCSQCHGPQRRSYENGAHGGMLGYWDLSRGPRSRNQCVDCHDAHVPAIPEVSPVLPPVDRGILPDPSAHDSGANGGHQ